MRRLSKLLDGEATHCLFLKQRRVSLVHFPGSAGPLTVTQMLQTDKVFADRNAAETRSCHGMDSLLGINDTLG